MRLRLTIRGDEAICDWTDSDEQAKGPINATFVVTAAPATAASSMSSRTTFRSTRGATDRSGW